MLDFFRKLNFLHPVSSWYWWYYTGVDHTDVFFSELIFQNGKWVVGQNAIRFSETKFNWAFQQPLQCFLLCSKESKLVDYLIKITNGYVLLWKCGVLKKILDIFNWRLNFFQFLQPERLIDISCKCQHCSRVQNKQTNKRKKTIWNSHSFEFFNAIWLCLILLPKPSAFLDYFEMLKLCCNKSLIRHFFFSY